MAACGDAELEIGECRNGRQKNALTILCGARGPDSSLQLTQPAACRDQLVNRQRRGAEASRELPPVCVNLRRNGEDLVAEPLGPCVVESLRQRSTAQHREDIIGQPGQPIPSGIRTKLPARQKARRQIVLRHIMRQLDRPGFRPMPAHQVRRRFGPPVRDDGEILGGLTEQRALRRPDPQREVAQWGCGLGPVAGRELNLGDIDRLCEAILQPCPRDAGGLHTHGAAPPSCRPRS